jgi:hypothetical protein
MKEEELDPRSPEYWGKLQGQVFSGASEFDVQLKRLFGIPGEQVFLRIATSAIEEFPSVTRQAQGILITFPDYYFAHMDHAAKWMNLDVPYRNSLAIASTNPASDVSTFIHWMWSRWVLLHEVAHAVCGHLGPIGLPFSEFPSVDSNSSADEATLTLRQAWKWTPTCGPRSKCFGASLEPRRRNIGMTCTAATTPLIWGCKMLP